MKTIWGTDILPQWKKQLLYYSYLVFTNYPVVNQIDTYIYFYHYKMTHFISRWSRDELPNMEKIIRNDIKRLKNICEKNEIRPSTYCYWCPYVLSCQPALLSSEVKEDMVKQYILYSAKLEALEERLRQIVKLEGNIIQDDYEVGYHETITYEVDEGRLFDYLNTTGGKDKVLSIFYPSIRQIKLLAKKDEELASFISPLVKTRWGIKRREDDKENK